MRGRNTKLSGNRAIVQPLLGSSALRFNKRDRIVQVQCRTPNLNQEYEGTNISVKQNNRLILPELAALGARIRAVRQAKGLNQKLFADEFEVTQGSVSNWEKGVDRPSPKVLAKLASMTANDELREFFEVESGIRAVSGLRSLREVGLENAMEVRLLKNSVAAGTPRALEENELEELLLLPRKWFPYCGEIFAVRVCGDSMSPTIESGYIVFIDTSKRDPKLLVEKMVAAREGGCVTIKWLRKDKKVYLLVPQHTSPRYPIRIMRPEGDFSIVGEVVKWIGYPPPVRK
jgi:SOS-response transcriptional repressor LexA